MNFSLLPDPGAAYIQRQKEPVLALYPGRLHLPLLGDVSGDALGAHENLDIRIAGNVEPFGIHQKNGIALRRLRAIFLPVGVIPKSMDGQPLRTSTAGIPLVDPMPGNLPVIFTNVIEKGPAYQFFRSHPITPYRVADKSESPHGIQSINHVGGRSDNRIQLVL